MVFFALHVIVARKDIIERESVRHCCVTVAAVAIYRMDTQPGSRPATFSAVGLSTRRIIRIGLRAANESRRVGESEARTIDSSSKRKRRCFDIFSHLCFQGSRTHLEPFSRFYKSKEPLYTDPPSPLHRCAHTRLFSLRFLLRRKW